MPYETFKQICVTGNVGLLGNGPTETLQDAWVDIYSEFYEISADDHIKAYVQEKADSISIENKIYRVKVLCALLAEHGYNEQIAGTLSTYDYHVTPDNILQDIETVISLLRNDEVQLQLLSVDDEKKQKATSAGFDEKISAIERLFKVPIDTHKLSTQMFAIKCKEYKEEVARLTSNNTNGEEWT